jgi:glycine cleavage system aminomethyltransferase T
MAVDVIDPATESRIGHFVSVQFLLEDPEPMLYHNEPIYRNGEVNGHTTSGMFGHTLGAAVALGYVHAQTGALSSATKSKVSPR